MRFTVQTSLLALVFAIGATDVFAAPAVRQLGLPSQLSGGATGSNSEDTSAKVTSGNTVAKTSATSASSGITSSRAGSIRTNPTMRTTGNSGATATVASGTGMAGRTASTPQRLSIGPYIGAPRQISSSGGGDTTEITNNINNINNEIQNITNIVEGLETDISGKVDIAQGTQYTGKALVVDTHGDVKPIGDFVTPDELDVDLSGKVDKDQGVGAAGHVLSVDADGKVTNVNEVYYKPEMDEKLAAKVDTFQGISKKGKALVVDNDGILKPIGEIPDAVDISGKVDKFQGPEHAGSALVVDQYGRVQPIGDFVETDQGIENQGKAMIVNDQGKVVPSTIDIGQVSVDLSGKVDKFQTLDNADTVLVVDENGWVADEKIKNIHVADDAALERSKMAADIVDTLDWVDTWKNKSPEPDNAARYVVALDEYGEKAWFKVVVTGDE